MQCEKAMSAGVVIAMHMAVQPKSNNNRDTGQLTYFPPPVHVKLPVRSSIGSAT